MENSTEVLSFVLAAYGNIGELKYLYFCIMLLWYLSICVNNAAVIMVIFLDKKLHEPMYILLCNLLANEIFVSTVVYPLVMSHMFSDTHEVTLPWCFLQIYCLTTCASIEFCSLAAMAYDRYVAICCPLHYNVIMNTRRVGTITVVIWMYSFVNSMFSFSFVILLKFCGNVIDKLFCDHYLIIKLACSVSVVNKVSDLLHAFVTIVIPFSLILVSYMKILIVCLNTSEESWQKAVTTCTPQIFSLSGLFIGFIFHFVTSKFNATLQSDKVKSFFTLSLLIYQPMLTPILYGLNLPKIKQSLKRFLFDRK
ncbi:olfactory receptor 11A1-like [Acanthopagrus latus]|uniref:olfactory receptor 11A1-like n=1 Tax=Acanthopagrus latus TaxID=8177 RepID=UPI00187BD576|nr:olfactory receptor 11A1-like [Acanthopagrus latus]